MNRFFRSALFPLIVIAALVWLAVQTLSGHGHKTTKATYGDVVQLIENDPSSIQKAVFNPGKRELTVTRADGKTKISVHYPSDQVSAFLNTELFWGLTSKGTPASLRVLVRSLPASAR